MGDALLEGGISLQRDGRVLPTGPHLERVLPGVEDDVVGRLPEFDALEQVLFTPHADVEGVGVGRGVNDAQPRLPLGQGSQVRPGDRRLQVVATARNQNLVGLTGIEIERASMTASSTGVPVAVTRTPRPAPLGTMTYSVAVPNSRFCAICASLR